MSDRLITLHKRKFIEELRRNTRDKNAYVKLSVLIFLDKGFGYEEIRDLLGVSVGKIDLGLYTTDEAILEKANELIEWWNNKQ